MIPEHIELDAVADAALDCHEVTVWDGGIRLRQEMRSTLKLALAVMGELLHKTGADRIDAVRLADNVTVLRWERHGRGIVQP